MKARKDRKTNDYLKSLEAEQSRRINQAGIEAYRSYYKPSIIGTMFKAIKGGQLI